ncbi:alkylglycerol monooxygenase-like isoform X1 [Rhodnius prolixus]|uniref:alkylglycerol monooxygenase-like isoform X1 n=1 Tax=Rhodnius prolixus TaxID=13249 RepID=UPI003D18DB31
MDLSTNESAPWLQGLAHMFYLVTPSTAVYKTKEEVPLFFRQSWPYFLMFMILENWILWLERKPTMRVNDGLTSLSHGLLQEIGRLLFRGGESWIYVWIYDHWRIGELQWDSAVTWYVAAVGVDFCYYWLHRACHEIHILWAQHQVHHSSEDFNLAVGLRQSVLQGWCGFIFYLPLAFFIPPSVFLTHQQFNLLYQFWIHTETVKSLGPLEWILNTPKHHRVHHGSQLYCLDKNYGGTLIVWDRLFGTFAEEREKEEIIYGLVMNQPSFNPIFLQLFYNMNVYNKFNMMEGMTNKISAVIKGPSWLPGKKWTGDDADKINVQSREKYDVIIPTWCNVYLILHFIATVISFQDLAQRYLSMTPVSVLLSVVYMITSLTVIGLMLEDRPNIWLLEMVRCSVLATLMFKNALSIDLPYLKWFFTVSAFFWLLHSLKLVRVKATVLKSQ